MGANWHLFNSDLTSDKWAGLYDRLGTTEFPDLVRRRWPEAVVELHDIGPLDDRLAERSFDLIAPGPPGPAAHLQLTTKSDDSTDASVSGSNHPLQADIMVWFRKALGPEHAVTFYTKSVFRFLEVPYGLDAEGMLALMAEASAGE